MTRRDTLERLFPSGWQDDAVFDNGFAGTGMCDGASIRYIGVENATEVGVDQALAMARLVLDTVKQHARRAILFLLDTQGQRLRKRDELLGLNGYMAHLAKCVELARANNHPILSLVYGEAVSGGYLATGMMADACYALSDAQIQVMNLPSMARITKIPLGHLEQLSEHSPVFSPGVANYAQMGHLQEIWDGELAAKLKHALMRVREARPADQRMALGQQRGGRHVAYEVVRRVEHAA